MRDYNKYVGIPWVCGKSDIKGADCWGIVTMVLRDYLNVNLGHYELSNIDTHKKAIKAFEQEMAIELSSGKWKRFDNPKELDIVMMFSKSSGRPDHVGIYIGKDMILHSMTRETGISEVHHLRIIKPLCKRMEYYRYVG